MHDPTPTKPSEIARIAQLANGDAANYRTEVLLLLAKNDERGRRHEQWMQQHDKLDDERHDGLVDDIQALRSSMGGVMSGIGDYNDTKAQVAGARKLIIGVVAVFAAVGGCILFAIEVVKALK